MRLVIMSAYDYESTVGYNYMVNRFINRPVSEYGFYLDVRQLHY